jgi:alpha-D-ribose 1-methylphosphonate 5-triphosphate synthase subunit PhnG
VTYPRERRAELLAAAEPSELVALADRCLTHPPEPVVLAPPEVGLVVLQVREPVADERFYLGEVVVTRAEVEVDGVHGWSMRLGDDQVAALAGAVCDAEAEAVRPLADDVEALCRIVEARQTAAQAAEWAELAPTEVSFEELDR